MGRPANSRRIKQSSGFYRGLAEQLSLYAKYMAWLQAAPKRQEGSKIQPQSPADKYPAGDPIFIMPPADEYITTCFRMAGGYKSGAAGVTPLDYTDIKSFMEVSGFELTSWQAEQIVSMSRICCSSYSKYTNSEKQFAPYQKVLTASEREIRNKNIMEAIKRSDKAG